MSVVPSQPLITTSATLIATNPATSGDRPESDYGTRRYIIKNRTGTVSVFLGGDNTVTTGNGFEWQVSDGPLEITLEPGESLYGIVAATNQTLHALRTGR